MNHETSKEVADLFDYEIKDESIPQLPEELFEPFFKKFKIAYIVGDSGSGKSSIIEQLLTSSKYKKMRKIKHKDKVILHHFDNTDEAISKLNAAGISSIPVWFRSYNNISSGEQSRFSLSRNLSSNIIVDEFTSNLDRLTARSLSNCIQKYIRNNKLKNIIFAGCQYDIIRWLQPDLIYDVNIKSFHEGYKELPMWKHIVSDEAINSYNIDRKKLILIRCERERWNNYTMHHYLSSSLLTNSTCWEIFVKIENIERAIGFISSAPLPSGTVKMAMREHRLVIIPSCQGIGIGIVASEAIAELYLSEGYRYFAKTSHPKLGKYRNNSNKWIPTSKNMKKLNRITGDSNMQLWRGTDRFCYSHEFTLTTKEKVIKPSTKNIYPHIHKKSEAEKLGDDLIWYPLKIFGTIKVNNAGDATARINGNYVRFEIDRYLNEKKTYAAAYKYLIKESQKKRVNLYTIIKKIVYIDISSTNDGSMLLKVDKKYLDKISDRLWISRYNRAYTMINSSRCYIEELLFPDRVIDYYVDGDKLNNTRKNLTFID